jgi:hypothetical protein
VIVLTGIAIWWRLRPASRRPWRVFVAAIVVFYLAATPIGANLLVFSLSAGMKPIQTREEARGADTVVILSGGV